MNTLLDEDCITVSETAEELTIDVSGAPCPEYTMLFCRAVRRYLKGHTQIRMRCTAPSIAQISTQQRLEYATDMSISEHNIQHSATETKSDQSYVVIFKT